MAPAVAWLYRLSHGTACNKRQLPHPVVLLTILLLSIHAEYLYRTNHGQHGDTSMARMARSGRIFAPARYC